MDGTTHTTTRSRVNAVGERIDEQMALEWLGVPRTAVLYQFEPDTQPRQTYLFLPEMNVYGIPSDVWTNPTRYRTGGETLLFEIILEGWIVQ
jgi:hypothetical protein